MRCFATTALLLVLLGRDAAATDGLRPSDAARLCSMPGAAARISSRRENPRSLVDPDLLRTSTPENGQTIELRIKRHTSSHSVIELITS
jgi:hypothetical protein